MPLDDAMPVIDDRRYDDIVAEIRARIARYTPEWQPGMERPQRQRSRHHARAGRSPGCREMMLYRMGQVPELNYLKFLELIGIELRAAQPATAEITLPGARQRRPRRRRRAGAHAGQRERRRTAAAGLRDRAGAARARLHSCKSVQANEPGGAVDARRSTTPADGASCRSASCRARTARSCSASVPAGLPNRPNFPALTFDLAVWTSTARTGRARSAAGAHQRRLRARPARNGKAGTARAGRRSTLRRRDARLHALRPHR